MNTIFGICKNKFKHCKLLLHVHITVTQTTFINIPLVLSENRNFCAYNFLRFVDIQKILCNKYNIVYFSILNSSYKNMFSKGAEFKLLVVKWEALIHVVPNSWLGFSSISFILHVNEGGRMGGGFMLFPHSWLGSFHTGQFVQLFLPSIHRQWCLHQW